jgi:hypothetical protein
LTQVDAATAGEATGWKYIGDSTQMLAVGFYPGDSIGHGGGAPNNGMARALTMGMLPPVWFPALTVSSAGLLSGSYQWAVAFRRLFTGARSNLSAATRDTQATPAVAVTNKEAAFTLPTTPIDPLTGAADANIVIDIYRFGGTVNRWAYVGTGASGTSFTDNIPDLQILSAPPPISCVKNCPLPCGYIRNIRSVENTYGTPLNTHPPRNGSLGLVTINELAISLESGSFPFVQYSVPAALAFPQPKITDPWLPVP